VTEESQDPSDPKKRPDWVVDAEEALNRASESLRAAWEATKDTRVGALTSAKQAAKQLGEAIDRGVEAARSRWNEGQDGAAEEE
jgi:hypothetical protein